MDKNHHNKKYQNWNNQKNNVQQNSKSTADVSKKNFGINHSVLQDEAAKREKQRAIQELKAREVVCAKCGQLITDISSAMTDKTSGNPIHFDCAFAEVEKNENLGPNEKIAYIGQGRFGVLYYENIRDQRHFTIKKIIDWDDKEKKSEWREEIGSLYSKVD